MENVASHVVGLIPNAKSGSIWNIFNGKAPTEMAYAPVNI